MKKFTFVIALLIAATTVFAQSSETKKDLKTETIVSKNIASEAVYQLKLSRQDLELKKNAGVITEEAYQQKLEKLNAAMEKAKALLREVNKSNAILKKDN